MQRLISQGQNALGISVARTLSAEQFSLSYSSSSSPYSSSDSLNSSGANSNTISNSTSSEDAELILNAIITISKLITESQTKRNKVVSGGGGGGNMTSLGPAPLAQAQETADSFSLSRDILRSITLACPESHIDKAIDLLICTDIVVAVQDRTQSKISISSTSTVSTSSSNSTVSTHQNDAHSMDDLNFIFSDTNYTKDGILMIPSSIQGPVLKFAQCEMQRRWTYSKSASSNYI